MKNTYTLIVFSFFVSELTLSDLQSLYDKARSFAGSRSAPCVWLYRNKPPKYFEDILLNRGGIMEVYVKDNSGDPGSPINGRIHGLFFMASVQRGSQTGEPDRWSAFGSCRLCIPVEELLLTAPRLYFADFYCMRSNKRHYVTLVMTKPGSSADRFCADRLLSLKVVYPNCNPFLFEDFCGQFRVSAKNNLYVEVLYTEDIDVRDHKLDHGVKTFGKGRSTKGGRPKNVNCDKCSLMVRQTMDFSCREPYALLTL